MRILVADDNEIVRKATKRILASRPEIECNDEPFRCGPFRLRSGARPSDILSGMLSRASKNIAALILLVCLLCPILELFDHWDHTSQTGDDTEYTLVVVGLCVGVAYAFARFVLTSPAVEAVSEIILHFSSSALAPGGRGPFFVVPIPLSPPILALRI